MDAAVTPQHIWWKVPRARCLQGEWWDQRRRGVEDMTTSSGASKEFCPAMIRHKLSAAWDLLLVPEMT